MFKLIILDRDGVINEDSPFYIKSPDEWNTIAGSLEAIVKLECLGYKVAIATNQSGIARNYFTRETLELIHKKMITQIAAIGGHVDVNDIFICPHGPEDHCECRKPKPGLLLKAMQHFSVEPQETLIIGDSRRDILAAKACGAAAVLVKTGKGVETLKSGDINVPVYGDLAEAIDLFVTKK